MLLRHLIPNRPVLDGLGISWAIGVGGMMIALLGIGLAPFLAPAVPAMMQAAAWLSLIPATVALASLGLGLRATVEGETNGTRQAEPSAIGSPPEALREGHNPT